MAIFFDFYFAVICVYKYNIMKKAITIKIPEPCQEDWAKMTPTEKGRHCKVCTKEVVDFTDKTDEDLVKYLTNNTNTCGRFKKSQLDREVKLERKSRNSLAPYAASLLLPLSMAANAIEQSSYSKAPQKDYISLEIGSLKTVIITGLIKDNKGALVSNATITIKETGVSTTTNKKGQYVIRAKAGNTLLINHKYYHEQEVTVSANKGAFNIVLESNETVIIKGFNTTKETQVVGRIISNVNKEIKISGNVTDDAGIPLPGANVIVKGTTIGTQTDFDGNYTLEVEPNQVLVYSYVGFETREVTTSNVSNTIDISLETGDFLGGIVVVGYAISVEESNYIEQFPRPQFREDPERKAWKEKLKKQHENEIEFKRIKQARKKADRQLKRKNRKTKNKK